MVYKDKEKEKANYKRFREKHREERNRKNHEWYIKNADQMRKRASEYRKTNREQVNKTNATWQRNIRKKYRHIVVQGYGGGCVCCGEKEELYIEIHHPNGHGKADVEAKGGDTMRFYKWLIDNNFPKEYWMLCANCHTGIHRSEDGICPHKSK